MLAADYPCAHSIEVPASLQHKLSAPQMEALQSFAASQCACRHDCAILEHAMEAGETFEAALSALMKDKAALGAKAIAAPQAPSAAAGGAGTPVKAAAAAKAPSAAASPAKF